MQRKHNEQLAPLAKLLRKGIPNDDVSRNFCGVCEYIDAAVKQSLSQLR